MDEPSGKADSTDTTDFMLFNIFLKIVGELFGGLEKKPYLCAEILNLKLQLLEQRVQSQTRLSFAESRTRLNEINDMKVQVTSDTLYQYLLEHNFTISLLSKYMGVSNGIVCNSFQHVPNRLGKPMKFSAANLERLNAALPQIADDLRRATITFGSDQTFTNSWGNTYDPATREAVLAVGNYFKITPFLFRVLGWKKGKRDMILVSTKSPVYGQVSQDDVNRINAELLSVAGVLSSYEVVEQNPDKQEPETPRAINLEKQADKPTKTKKEKGTPAQAPLPLREGQGVGLWDDTTLDLWERYAAFHRLFPDGLIAFAVNDGFTVCEEDARLLARVDTTLKPYTDPTTGHVTLYMDAAKWQQIRRAWDDGDEMVAESPMYPAE